MYKVTLTEFEDLDVLREFSGHSDHKVMQKCSESPGDVAATADRKDV